MARFITIKNLNQVTSRFNQLSLDVQDELKDALDISLRDVKDYAQKNHRFISRTGTSERETIGENIDKDKKNKSVEQSIGSEASYGAMFKGTVGSPSIIALYLHEGTKKHTIMPRKKFVLRWLDGKKFYFAKRVRHPGIKADPFLENALEHEKPAIISRFELAINRAIAEMR